MNPISSALVADLGHRELSRFEYAIINPMRVEVVNWCDLKPIVLGAHIFAHGTSLLPRLIFLNSLGNDVRATLLEKNTRQVRQGHGPLFSALLSSARSPEVVAAHLSTKMIGVSNNSEKYWLRFHDPSVFDRLDWLLNDAQMRWFLGPVDAWSWFDRFTGTWRQRIKPIKSKDVLPSAFTSEQWSALGRQRFLNKTLKLLTSETLDPFDGGSLVRRIDSYVGCAMSMGLEDVDDICAFAIQVERFGLQWLASPVITEAIDSARTGKKSFFTSMAELQS